MLDRPWESSWCPWLESGFLQGEEKQLGTSVSPPGVSWLVSSGPQLSRDSSVTFPQGAMGCPSWVYPCPLLPEASAGVPELV